MKVTLLFAATLLVSAPVLPAEDDEDVKKPAAKPAAEKPAAKEEAEAEDAEPGDDAESSLTDEQAALKTALENHARLKGFHVEVVLKTPEGKATLKGSLGEGSLSLDCTDVKGAKKKRLVAGGEFFLSEDGGKTWKKGDDADKETTLLFNNIITAPLALAGQLIKDDFTAKEEKLNGEEVLHLEKPAKDDDAALHIWLCREPELENMTFVRKVDMIVSGTDIELPATITYSKLGEPVEITAPEEK